MASSGPPRALGRYVLDEQIATGATATIWRAHDTTNGTEVAVKRFHPYLFSDRVARKRMENEAKAARRVRAHTVVSAIDRISTRDEFALVFPFIAGTSLADRLRELPPVTSDRSAAIAADIADALVAIHKASLVHRDVKPGNVLLGTDGRARLLDFGISRTVTDGIEAELALTGSGLAIGTLPYMAPEQIAAGPTTAATDVFALGVVLYEMLAGTRPFSAASPAALAAEQQVMPPRIAAAPAPLVELVLRALAVEPAARPTAAHMSQALRDWLTAPVALDAPTAPLTTAVPTVAETSRRWSLPPQLLTAGLAVAAVLVVAIVALAALAPGSGPAAAAPSNGVAAAATATKAPKPSATAVPVAPAAVRTPQPQPTAAPVVTPAAPTPPNPSPPPNPRHRHHHHGHHHRKHHHH